MWWALALAAAPTLAAAQLPQRLLRAPRSTDYLFAADVQDARALWVNPAGLGAFLQTSVMGEVVVDRLPIAGGDLALAQYTIGFNSRGLSFGYAHDRFGGTDSANSTLRFGLARGFQNLALGATITFYRSDVTQRGLDLGMRYQLAPPLAVAAVVSDLGEPAVRDTLIRPRGRVSATGYLLNGQVTLSGELVATQRPPTISGYDLTYRAGAGLQSGGRLPIGGLVALDFDNGGHVGRWSVGLSIGGPDRVIGTTTIAPNAASGTLDRLAVTGVATRRPPR
jgi:hypothetical protein